MGLKSPVIVIGAGISGMAAGITLKEAGQEVLIIESADQVGGRVRTDLVDGFRLDRGFQVLLKSYPEAQKFLDYPSLNLKPFLPGARVLMENGNFLVMDPSRNPRYLFDTLVSPIGSIGDKLKMLSLRLSLMTKDLESNFEKEEISTLEYLYKWGFSKKIIDRFFIPFLGGIYLENELKTSSRMFEFVYRLFGTGDTVVPALGMQEIPNKMALRLGYSSIRLDEKVLEIEEGSVRTDKNVYPAKAIIFAGGSLKNFPGPQSRTLQNQFPNIHPRSALTLYFSAPKLPIKENIIVLNANPRNWVNTLAVMNSVSEAYSPEGIHLLSITLKNPNALDSNPKLTESVKEEMGLWFPETKNWKFIRSYFIPYALPDQDQVRNQLPSFQVEGTENLYVCGDYLFNGSINAAMKTGRLAAEEYLSKL